MKVILIVNFREEYLLYSFGIELAGFNLLKVYCAGERFVCDIPLEDIENIGEVRDMDYTYLINGGSGNLGNTIDILLKHIAPENKIMCARKFLGTFLSPLQTMKYQKEAVKIGHQELLDRPDVMVGDYSYGNPEVFNDGNEQILTIGKCCSIATGVKILLCMDHRPDWNTTYPFINDIVGHPYSKGNITIGNDVWIGMNAIILSGVTIGDGCVIGAGAVVTHSIPPYGIAVGNPAKVVKKRFSDEVIERFLEMQWWNWDDEQIYHAMSLLQSGNTEGLYAFFLKEVKQ